MPMKTPHIAIVILNWNGKKFLEKFLGNVVENSQKYAEIIVADNASTDDSIDYLQKHFPSIRIIENTTNYGFAEGYNRALSKVKADYYVLLNSDIEVAKDWIQPVIEMMENDKQIGAAQPKILSYQEKDHFEYAGAAGGYIDKYGYPFCRGRLFQSIEKDQNQYNDSVEIFWATGACLFVRAELYNKLGGLDNDFFAHMEEIDFCWRLKNADYKIMYCPHSIIYHVGGGTLSKSNSRKTFLNFRNNFSLLYKNLPANQLVPVFTLRLFLDGIAGLKFLFEGHYRDLWAVVLAHFSFYKNFNKLRRKRKLLMNKKVSCVYEGSLVKDYYLNGKKIFSDLVAGKFRK